MCGNVTKEKWGWEQWTEQKWWSSLSQCTLKPSWEINVMLRCNHIKLMSCILKDYLYDKKCSLFISLTTHPLFDIHLMFSHIHSYILQYFRYAELVLPQLSPMQVGISSDKKYTFIYFCFLNLSPCLSISHLRLYVHCFKNNLLAEVIWSFYRCFSRHVWKCGLCDWLCLSTLIHCMIACILLQGKEDLTTVCFLLHLFVLFKDTIQ